MPSVAPMGPPMMPFPVPVSFPSYYNPSLLPAFPPSMPGPVATTLNAPFGAAMVRAEQPSVVNVDLPPPPAPLSPPKAARPTATAQTRVAPHKRRVLSDDEDYSGSDGHGASAPDSHSPPGEHDGSGSSDTQRKFSSKRWSKETGAQRRMWTEAEYKVRPECRAT